MAKSMIAAALALCVGAALVGADGYCWMQRLPCRMVVEANVAALNPEIASAAAATHVVGPGRQHETVQTVPWEKLGPGDVVEIHAGAEPYRDKWLLRASGAEGRPIVVRGVRGPDGKRPAFQAEHAKTRAELISTSGGIVPNVPPGYDNADRGILQVRGAHIVVDGLRFTGARVRVPWITSDDRSATYSYNAAGIYAAWADHLTIRDCEIDENGDGIFVASPRPDPSGEILIEHNYVHDNSYRGGGDQYHNLYLEALKAVVQWNHFGPPAGPEGTNLKDRSAEIIIQNNWIEGGNRQIDLVESIHPAIAGRGGIAIVENNVLVDQRGWDNAQIVNFGRDMRRDGVFLGAPRSFLRMAGNTLMSPRADAVGLRVSDPAEVNIRGNVLYADLDAAAGGRWFWMPAGVADPVGNAMRTVAEFATVRTGKDPVLKLQDLR